MYHLSPSLFTQNEDAPLVFVAFELSKAKWKLMISHDSQSKHLTIDALRAEDWPRLVELMRRPLKQLGVTRPARVFSCYEAGRDGFWLHEALSSLDWVNLVLDSSSIEVNRKYRRAKNDALDVRSLCRTLQRYHGGESDAVSVVRVPDRESDDLRRLTRERDALKTEETKHRNRIRSLLITRGIDLSINRDFLEILPTAREWDGNHLPAHLLSEIRRQFVRLRMVWTQLQTLETEMAVFARDDESTAGKMIQALTAVRGIGLVSAFLLVTELFGWRKFENRRQLAGLVGLTPTPYDSGGMRREQGISKAGRSRIRALLIQISWLWLRYQPESKLTLWFQTRYTKNGKRHRRVGIVAVARKLLIALWRYVEQRVHPPTMAAASPST